MTDPIYLTIDELKTLPEYSCTLPTGTTIGKRWRTHRPYRRRSCASNTDCGHWWLGAYVADPDPTMVQVRWQKVTTVRIEKTPLLSPPTRQAWTPEID